MAQQENVKFVDDLDGSVAAGTVSFASTAGPMRSTCRRTTPPGCVTLASFVAAGRKSGESARSVAGHRR